MDNQIKNIQNSTQSNLESFSQQDLEPNQPNHDSSHEHEPVDFNSPWLFFINKPRTSVLLILTILSLGIFSLLNVNIEANPEINQPIGAIQTIYPNSSAADVESEITIPIEKEVANLSKVQTIQSTSLNNVSSVFVTFESSKDPDKAITDLREAVNKVSLPSDAETPEVLEFDFNNQPIVTLSVLGPQTKTDLTEISKTIVEEVESISGVSRVEVSGDEELQISIVVDRTKLDAYGISLNQITQAIQQNNLNLPLGSVKNDNNSISFRLLGKAETVETIKKTPITNLSTDGSFALLTLEAVATVNIEPKPEKTRALVKSHQSSTPLPSINLNVYKKSSGNIVNIVESIDEKITELNQSLPSGTEILKTNDNAYFIRTDLETLSVSGIQTIFIIFFALLLVLSFKESLIASLAIPLIFLATFATNYLIGQTLNSLTIFSLILSLGLIVDTSIVIVEGIFEFRQEGYTTKEAAAKSIMLFKGPLIAGTLTTIAAFFPMLLVSGIVGEFIKTIPIVLSITLTASLFVSIAISPLLATIFIRKKSSNNKDSLKLRTINKLKNFYGSILKTVLESKLLRVGILLLTITLFFASLALPITGLLKAQLFPVVDTPFLYVNTEAPAGTSIDANQELLKPVEAILNNQPAIDNYVINIGRNISLDQGFGSSDSSSELASFILNLTDLNETDRLESFVLAENLRTEFEKLNTPLIVKVEAVNSGPPTSAPLAVQITGENIGTLKDISKTLKIELGKIDGLVNLESSFDKETTEANLKIDPEKAAYYGLSNAQIAQTIQLLTNGSKVGNLTINNEDTDIRLYLDQRLESEDIATLQASLQVPIQTPKGIVPLAQIASVDLVETLDSIPRKDEKRNVSITGYTEKEVLIQNLLPEIQSVIDTIEKPTGYEISLGGEDEDIQESFRDLFQSMIIAVILILVILVVIFNSFRQTAIVLSTLPLAVIGIFPGLATLGLPLSFPAFLGVVMLTGIVVNDAIVLLDQVNINRKEGMELEASILDGATSRLVPIILTSITTILGLLPITISDEFWRGLGFSVIFGLLTATFLTLFIIPILYRSFYWRHK